MRILPLVFLFLVAVAQALGRYPRTGPSSLALMIPSFRALTIPSSRALTIPAAWISSSFSRHFETSPPRLVATFLSSSNPEKLDALEEETRALKHLLKGGNSTTASEDIRESVLIYEGGDKDWLRGILKDLINIQSKAAVGSKGPADMGASELLVAAKDETIRVLSAAKEESYRFQRDIIAEKNVELMGLQGRLALRFVVEEFEKKVAREEVVKMKELLRVRTTGGKAPSTREATWEVILRSNMNTIATYLIGENRALTDEEIKRWVNAVQDLHLVTSKYIHNYSTDKVSINTVWLTVDASKLAVGICETLPVKCIIERAEMGGESADPAGYNA
jgi:hypothetical protein